MKILSIYFILAFMGFIMAVIIDVLSGTTLSGSIQSIHASFAVTSLKESITMIVFVSLPFINAIVDSIRKRNHKSIK